MRSKGLPCSDDADVKGMANIFISKKGIVNVGKGLTLRSGARRGIGNGATTKIIVNPEAELKIGDHVGMTNVCLLCQNKIEIGDYVLLGADVMVMDSNFHDTDWRRRMDGAHGINGAKTAPVKIGNNVFVGTRSIICKGVTIGARSIIAAGSVVVKDIPEDCIAGGNPCMIVRKINEKQ